MGGGMGGGGKGNSKTENTIRYAPYLESAHQAWLAQLNGIVTGVSGANPLGAYADLDFSGGLYGSLAISSFPSLYDMYGKFMAGLDVEVLFNQAFEDTINGTVVSNAISQEADRLSDDIIEVAAPRLETGLRDINSVMSSSFVNARGLMETARTKAIARFSVDLKVKLLPVVTERWKTHLSWNRGVIEVYLDVVKFSVMAEMDTQTHNMDKQIKSALWPLNGVQHYTAALGTLSGATNTTSEAQGASRSQKMLGGAMMGAATGAAFGVPGMVIGGLVGLAAGLF